MNHIRSLTAFYPSFQLGGEPRAVQCELCIVEGHDGALYLKTPFACLDAHKDTDLADCVKPGRGYYATAAECEAYLASEYPHWQTAAPIMDALCRALGSSTFHCHEYGVAEKIGVSLDGVYKIARGHKSYTAKRVRAAVKALKAPAVRV